MWNTDRENQLPNWRDLSLGAESERLGVCVLQVAGPLLAQTDGYLQPPLPPPPPTFSMAALYCVHSFKLYSPSITPSHNCKLQPCSWTGTRTKATITSRNMTTVNHCHLKAISFFPLQNHPPSSH